jgi:hypothetical protein
MKRKSLRRAIAAAAVSVSLLSLAGVGHSGSVSAGHQAHRGGDSLCC